MTHNVPLEIRLRSVVAVGQWSTSWMIAVAFFCVVVRVSLPAELVQFTKTTFAITAPTFLVAGMILCLRLPGLQKVVALLANTVLISAGVLFLQYTVATSTRDAALSNLERVQQSEEWVRTSAQVAGAQNLITSLTARVTTAPAWAIFDIDEALKSQNAVLSNGLAHLALLEASAKVPLATATNAFELFGEGSATTVIASLAFILAVANEAIAWVLLRSTVRQIWKPARGAPKKDVSSESSVGGGSRQSPDWDDEELAYLRIRQKLIALNKPSGYREVSAAGPMNLGWCKRVVGKIRKKLDAMAAS